MGCVYSGNKYIGGFTYMDLISRGYPSGAHAQYIANAAITTADFTPSERQRLTELAAEADAYICTYNPTLMHALITRANLDKLASIPWKFAKIRGTAYESGMPHTRNDIIFLSDKNDTTMNTLLHEKVHLFTRAYPTETASILRAHGFSEIPRPNISIAFHRANPDINKSAYFNPYIGKIFVSQYNNPIPYHTNQIDALSEHEHPYEWLAYAVHA
jgi:hypothetical protein